MSAKHGIAGAVFLVMTTGLPLHAQTEIPFLKSPPPATVDSSIAPLPAPRTLPFQQSSPSIMAQPAPSEQVTPAFLAQPAPPQVPPPFLAPPAGVVPAQIPSTGVPLPFENAPYCCGPIGAHGPIGTELYVRTGPSFVVGGGGLASALRTGWDINGGGRSLFYTADGRRAWLLDANLSYIANGGNLSHVFQGIFGTGDNVTIRGLNRTALSVGIGHDWWCCGPGDVGSWFNPNYRFGVDGGATYGTSHVDLNSPIAPGAYERIQKIYGGAYVGLHIDMEIPMGAWTFVTGLRGEWAVNDLHLLPGNNTINDINLLWNVGIRY